MVSLKKIFTFFKRIFRIHRAGWIHGLDCFLIASIEKVKTIVFHSANLILMEEQRSKVVQNITLPRQIEYFKSLEMPQEISLSVHHMQHAFVHHFELILDWGDYTLIQRKMNRHVDCLFTSMFSSELVDLNFLSFVSEVVYDARELVLHTDNRGLIFPLLSNLLSVFDFLILLSQLPSSSLVSCSTIFINLIPDVSDERFCEDFLNKIIFRSLWFLFKRSYLIGLLFHLIIKIYSDIVKVNCFS